MQHIAEPARVAVAATAQRALLFWEHRLVAGGFRTAAEREIAERNRDAYREQVRVLRGNLQP